ncbi:MAG: 23S rRNA (pseudouridine(1915)-N(3))-methyltransferase RlmH, partial [Schleiferiaceae bacterium]|nr:23S rRNA (pseudouridine(1915)-N(3))-methyltransferase RlmH [Schleiferiaceae bacterium]
MEIILLVVGSTQEKYIKDGLEVYSNRLSKYSKFKIVSVLNSDKLYDFIKKGDRFILLDERGSSFSSRGLSNQFQKWMNSGPKRLI